MAAFHPFSVHFPIVLVLIWPFVEWFSLLFGRSELTKLSFGVLVLAIVASLVSTITGQAAFEQAIELGVPAKLLNTHADNANLIPWVLLVVLAFRSFLAPKWGRLGRVGAIVLGLWVGGFVVSVGRNGGKLVYEHGVGVRVLAKVRGS